MPVETFASDVRTPNFDVNQMHRGAVACKLLPYDMLRHEAVVAMPTEFSSFDAAYRGVIATRAHLIERWVEKVSLETALQRQGANCIASALAGCALALFIREPLIKPVFVMEGGNARALFINHDSEDPELYRLTMFDRSQFSVVRQRSAPRPIDRAIARNHENRQSGHRAFYREGSGIAVRGNEYTELTPDQLDENGYPNVTAAVLAVSGDLLVPLSESVSEWYGVKTSKRISDETALQAVPEYLRCHLPWNKSSSVQ